MSELHVFQLDGDPGDTVIARDVDDAWLVVEETTGCTREENDLGEVEFVQLDESRLFKLRCEGEPIENNFPSYYGWTKDERGVWCSERTCAEWVQHAGRGHLGSSEW
ncbi:MAG TPA: hypothetical protein VK550_12190 [Polyangiaceae bacterium]|nr:hypothetical protein [Polyangiaceae bacterium]